MRSWRYPVFVGLALGALSACSAPSWGPAPKLEFPPREHADPGPNGFVASVALTMEVDRLAVRRPPLVELVDAQIAAMRAYTREHGHGTADLDADGALNGDAATAGEAEDVATRRLARAGLRFGEYLGLDSGPAELGGVMTRVLAERLGTDAVLRSAAPERTSVTNDLVPDARDGVDVLWFSKLARATVAHAFDLMTAWSQGSSPPAAIVLDFSACEIADPRAAAALLSVFSSDASFRMLVRDASSDGRRVVTFHADAVRVPESLRGVPVFAVVSSRTDAVLEAVALALRELRGARVVGGATGGTGHFRVWMKLPDRVEFAFTAGDVLGPDGAALEGRPLIPDACLAGGELTPLVDRTLESFRLRCTDPDGQISTRALADYVRRSIGPPTGGASGPTGPYSLVW